MTVGRRGLAGVGMIVVAVLLILVASNRAAIAASPSGAIVFVGTDNNIHYAHDAAAKPECLTCPAEGMKVERATGIQPVFYQPVQIPEIPSPPPEGPHHDITQY